MTERALYVVAALLVVAVNSFFVATEFAIVRVRATRIEEMVQKGVRRAAAARHVLRRLDTYISACQLGVTISSLALGWLGEAAFASLLKPAFERAGAWQTTAAHSVAIGLAFLLITFLHVVFGELVPKTLTIRYPETTALLVAWPIRVFYALFYPLIWSMNSAAHVLVRALGIPPPSDASLAHSEAELRMILAVSQKSGALSEPHARLLANVLDFPDRSVRQIMVPRGDVVALDLERPFPENMEIARSTGHTRYPLCEGDLDRVVGVVNIKDLFQRAAELEPNPDLKRFARDSLFIPETVRIEQVLALFQKKRVHLAIVVDEYGGMSGIVTLEDVLEELIGEIQDEFDQEAPLVQRAPDGRVLVDASLALDEMEEQLHLVDDTEEDVDTIGGLVLARLGRLARVGDRVEIGGRTVEVVRVRGRRIIRLAVQP
jgi:CBS domain containing-hemolysin-like protein